jgi:hypothetical protein
MAGLRSRVLAVARPAFRAWIDSLPPERFSSFGLPSPEEARRAELLSPLPLYRPNRSPGELTRRKIEALLDTPPIVWLVPVEAGGHVVALVTVEAGLEAPPEAIELGKPWAASRLDAGVQLLQKLDALRWTDLRFLAFNSPSRDLLLSRSGKGWTWLELAGPAPGEARVLAPTQVEALLATLRDTSPQKVP